MDVIRRMIDTVRKKTNLAEMMSFMMAISLKLLFVGLCEIVGNYRGKSLCSQV